MDSKIIKAFFDGALSDESIRPPRTREYTKIDERETELYNRLRSQLTADQQKLFDEFVDIYGERCGLGEKSYYIRGFKFGLRLAVECFDLSDVDKDTVD